MPAHWGKGRPACVTERVASVLWGKSKLKLGPTWWVYHPRLGLHFQGSWLPWVETGSGYQGPEDPVLGSWEGHGRAWGVVRKHPWQGPL